VGEVTTDNVDGRSGRAVKATAGERIEQVLDFIRQECVDKELIFTTEHAAQLKQRTGMTTAHAYATLKSLEKKGIITREKLAIGKGILITFADKANPARAKNSKSNASGGNSIKEIRATAMAEIAKLEQQVREKKKFLDQLNSYVGKAKEGQ